MTTKVNTIAAMVCELIEMHMAKCDEAFPHPDDRPPHIIGQEHGTSANIQTVSNVDLGAEHLIHIELDDGTSFNIRVEEA
ncbi:MAG: hypothetical protein M9945_14435 [Aquamicrobium sp.]|uniref:hypothetical protein n=1 Tax=Aquamicrobium sp. TaxID=1872579 RepID=UPI00349E5A81|nr:hypothetical protein [Aquamicrobium sp.]